MIARVFKNNHEKYFFSYMKKVSVILTTFNSEKTLQKSLDSVLNQVGIGTEFEIELIAVDDCSSDKTRSILVNNGIDYLSTVKNSGGPNIGRNIGIKKSTGDYICVMDHDDVWLPEKIQHQLSYTDMAPIISTGYTTINEISGDKKDYVSHSKNGSGYIFYKKNDTFRTLLSRSKKGQKTYIGGLLIHKSLKHISFEEKFAQVDFDWGLKLFKDQESVEICKPLFIRSITGSNLSLNEDYRMNDYNFSIQTAELYKKDYPRLVNEFLRRANGTMGRYYYRKEDMSNARYYFLKSGFNIKSIFYLLTTLYGYKFVNKYFRVF